MSTWTYPRCIVVEVHDGDTIKVDIDLGQDMWVKGRAVRLAGVAARELKDPGGVEARDFLKGLLPTGTLVQIDSTGWDKYAGRIDGLVRTPAGLVQDALVHAGHAAPWNGLGVQPKPAWPIPSAETPA